MRRFGIMFLCANNSCRSQMAEGWAKFLGGNALLVQSAGIEAQGINPLAVKVMSEVGIDISGQQSTQLDRRMFADVDLLITVCGHADESCPTISTDITRTHWPMDDPTKVVGTEEEVLSAYRKTCEHVKQQVQILIDKLKQSGKLV